MICLLLMCGCNPKLVPTKLPSVIQSLRFGFKQNIKGKFFFQQPLTSGSFTLQCEPKNAVVF